MLSFLAVFRHDLDKLMAYGLLLCLPLFLHLQRTVPRFRHLLMFLMGFQFFKPAMIKYWGTDAALAHLEPLERQVMGYELSGLDFVALGIWYTNYSRRLHWSWGGNLIFPRLLFLGAMLLSVRQSTAVHDSLFCVVLLLRTYLVFDAVRIACGEPGAMSALLDGLALALICQLPLMALQKIHAPRDRAAGTFPSPNAIALVANMIVGPSIALFLAGRASRLGAATLIGVCCIHMLCKSRAGLIVFMAVIVLVSILSVIREYTPAKGRRLAVFGSILGAVAITFVPYVIGRFKNLSKDQSYTARQLLAKAAKMMLHDHPWGVGVNRFTHTMAANNYAEVVGLSHYGLYYQVHNIYYLVACEMGWPGIISFLFLLASLLSFTFRAAARNRGPEGDVALGIGVSLLTMLIHGFADHVLFYSRNEYLLWVLAAVGTSTVYYPMPVVRAAARRVRASAAPVGVGVQVARVKAKLAPVLVRSLRGPSAWRDG